MTYFGDTPTHGEERGRREGISSADPYEVAALELVDNDWEGGRDGGQLEGGEKERQTD